MRSAALAAVSVAGVRTAAVSLPTIGAAEGRG